MTNSPDAKFKQAVRLERHSAGAPGSQAYGDFLPKQGAGKFNWGHKRESEEQSTAMLDSHDPMYDSDAGEVDRRARVGSAARD